MLKLVVENGSEAQKKDPIPAAEKLLAWVMDDGDEDKADQPPRRRGRPRKQDQRTSRQTPPKADDADLF